MFLDDDRRFLHVLVSERANGRHFSHDFCKILQDQPEVAGYDQVWNLLNFDGDATNEDIGRILKTYLEVSPEDPPAGFTCLVTYDQCMAFWAAAMDEQFKPRRHLVMRTLDQAEGWLRQIRGWDRGEGPRSAEV